MTTTPLNQAAVRWLLPVVLCTWSTAWAGPTGPGPYNTGVDAAGVPQSGSATDPHFRIVNSAAFGPSAYAVRESDGPPVVAGTWLLDNTASAWLVPVRGIFFTDVPGVTDLVTYETTFDLSGYDASTGSITGLWAADDSGLEIRLNGVAVPGVAVAQYDRWTAFSISSGFVGGVNTLQFDTLSTLTPTGLRVEFNSVFQRVPEPATWALVMLGLAGTRLVRRSARVL